uniref:Alpha/beta superfamily hydrolase n=1 Tax=uncultured bacterium Contig26 TaxID=1393545 RepID=W0FNA5_9BACT|nr:alpha/beta superfamily hydrolase [uncultured bacterium Contig26]
MEGGGMHIHTHGIKGDPVIVILHPMGITGEKMYEIVGSRFGGKYFFITPDMGGHGSEKRKFRSARAEAAALHSYLRQKDLTQILLLYGASLGCAVSLHLLQYDDLRIEHIYLDGAPVARLSALMCSILHLCWSGSRI